MNKLGKFVFINVVTSMRFKRFGQKKHMWVYQLTFSKDLTKGTNLLTSETLCPKHSRNCSTAKEKYRLNNKEKISAYNKSYYDVKRDDISDYKKCYYQAKKDELAQRNACYYQENKERLRLQKLAHKEKLKAELSSKSEQFKV